MTSPTLSPDPSRRPELDALRVAAFGLLILYHVGMVYVTWDWHVKSPHASAAFEPAMLAANPWRLMLLFLVSGCATRFLLDKEGPRAFAASRFERLFWPLLVGIVLIVPPQSYFEVVQKQGFEGSYFAFWGRYLSFDQSFGLILPTYNHLWFVAYVLAYAFILGLGAYLLRGRAFPLVRLPPLLWLILPALYLFVARMVLYPLFGDTHALVDDWYNHARFGAAFLLGFAIAKDQRTWDAFVALRWASLSLAAAAYAAFMILSQGARDVPSAMEAEAVRAAREAFAWWTIMAALGWARRLVRRGGPILARLSEAVFPLYIAHQTLIVLTWAALQPLRLSPGVEAAIVLVGTFGGSWVFYEMGRRAGPLRPSFGLKAEPWARKQELAPGSVRSTKS